MSSPTLQKLLTIIGIEREASTVAPCAVAAAARERSLAFAEQAASAPQPGLVPTRIYRGAPVAKLSRARAFAERLADTRLGLGPDAGPQLSNRAQIRFQRDPFAQRLARLH